MGHRTCAQCASPLGPEKQRNAVFCGRACKDLARREVDKAELRQVKAEQPRTCPGCRKDITFARADAQVCSPACATRMKNANMKQLRHQRGFPLCRFCSAVLTDRRGKVCFGEECRRSYKREIYYRGLGSEVPVAECRFCGAGLSNPKAFVCSSDACKKQYKRQAESRRVAGLTGDALERFKNRKSNDSHRRRLAQAAEDSRPVSLRDWNRLLVRYRHRCAYCGKGGRLTREHVIPLVRGGRHAIGNLVPACWSCNCSKRQLLLVEWRRRQATKGR